MIYLAVTEVGKGLITEHDGDVGLCLGRTAVHRAGRFEVNGPCLFLAFRVLHAHLEDACSLIFEFDVCHET